MPAQNGIWKKVFLIALVLGGISAFCALGLQTHLSFEALKASQADFQQAYRQHPLSVFLVFAAIYVPMVALSLPGAAAFGLLAGALFGAFVGTAIVSLLATSGAALAFLLSRTLFYDMVQARFGGLFARIDKGLEDEGTFYLFSMRLTPVIPFFAINMIMGITSMRLRTFVWVSLLGMLPGTFVYVNAGSQLGRIQSVGDVFSPMLIASFILLGLFPLLMKRVLDFYRRRMHHGERGEVTEILAGMPVTSSHRHVAPAMIEEAGPSTAETVPESLARCVAGVLQRCDACGACARQCAFLQKRGTPHDLARLHEADGKALRALAYECSLCGLCGSLCPKGVDPCALFLELRRHAAALKELNLRRYKCITGYEKKGNSRLFSYYGLPQGCDTVLFPGCNIPGSRPGVTWKLFHHLREHIPVLGIVLDCCNKPSHDLGRQDYFETMFGQLRGFLLQHGVTTVLVACPNCFKVFHTYGQGLKIRTVYEQMLQSGAPLLRMSSEERADTVASFGPVVTHDPCPLRYQGDIHKAVRDLAKEHGLELAEMRHTKKRTTCCGEGGSTGFYMPEYAQAWGRMRQKEAQKRPVLTYCAGCAGFLKKHVEVFHILDLLFRPHTTLKLEAKVVPSPLTYWQRLRLKRRFRKELQFACSKERQPLP